MRTWSLRLILLAVVIALGVWGWRTFFPSPEKIIRKRLGELAKAASFVPNEGPLAKAWNASLLADFFTPDVQVRVEVPGSWHTISGRDDLLRAALGVRSTLSALTIEFPEVPMGRVLRGHTGIAGDAALRGGSPVRLAVAVDGEEVGAAQEPPRKPGWHVFQADTARHAGRAHRLAFTISAADPGARWFCFDAMTLP